MRRPTSVTLGAALFLCVIAQTAFSTAVADSGSIKGTVKATTGASNTTAVSLSGARLTLVNRDLSTQTVKTVTDEAGNFAFSGLPAATYVLTVEADELPTVTREIRLTAGAAVTVDVELTASLSESVTVRDEEGLLSRSETTTANTVREATLKNVPLRAENYQSALLLTPGVVRGVDGEDHIKGARSGQNAYTVNGADVTDPVTGKLAFDIPIEAVASVQIEENPYSAEFGRLTGGATNLETKGGDNKFKFTAARVFPTFRRIFGGPIDSFRPRVTFRGPLVRDKLFFLQSFEYRFSRLRVPSLKAPQDDSTSAAFNSFTQIDSTLNKNNRIKLTASFFPQLSRFVGLNTFNPQATTPDIRQHGALFSVSEQAIFGDSSFLSSSISYKTFNVHVYGQGEMPLTLAPDVNTGNYFATTRRETTRLQWQETYFARPLMLAGQHSFRVGTEFNRAKVSAVLHNNSISIRRRDQTLAQRIEFAGTGMINLGVGDVAAFVQDRWVANPRLTLDVGARLERDGIAQRINVAPRVSFLFLPFKGNRTILRGGAGFFYDRTPLSVSYMEKFNQFEDDEGTDRGLIASSTFGQVPERVVTLFAADGRSVIDGPRRYRNLIDEPLRNPRSLRWSLQLDQGITKNLMVRASLLQRTSSDDLIIEPRSIGSDNGVMALGSHGHSQYRELQMLALYNSNRFGTWNASYVWSSSRGDLNTVDNFLADLPAFVIRANEYGPLPWDTPHRFLIYGQVRLPFEIAVSPSLEIHSGYPYSIVNEQLDFVGARNKAGHFPNYFSLDLQVTKGIRIPKFDKHRARIGVAIFNITNHFNPRDLQNNLGSHTFGQFFNSLGTSLRGKFEMDF